MDSASESLTDAAVTSRVVSMATMACLAAAWVIVNDSSSETSDSSSEGSTSKESYVEEEEIRAEDECPSAEDGNTSAEEKDWIKEVRVPGEEKWPIQSDSALDEAYSCVEDDPATAESPREQSPPSPTARRGHGKLPLDDIGKETWKPRIARWLDGIAPPCGDLVIPSESPPPPRLIWREDEGGRPKRQLSPDPWGSAKRVNRGV